MTVTVPPTFRVVLEATADTPVSTDSVTVMVTVPDSPPAVAVTVAVPATNAVTVPDVKTGITEVSLDVQVGLIVAVVPSL
jgi:hypothetical protein